MQVLLVLFIFLVFAFIERSPNADLSQVFRDCSCDTNLAALQQG